MPLSFNSKGATPFSAPTALNSFTSNLGTTPQSKALNNSINPNVAQGLSIGSGGQPLVNGAPPIPYNQNATTASALLGPLAQSNPSTALKSTTQNNVDGSSTTNTYHAPDTGLINGTSQTNSASTSNPNANYNAGILPPTASQGTPVTGSSNSATYPGLISSLSSFNPFANKNVSDPYNNAQELNTELQQSRTNEANSVAQNRLNPIPIGDQTGREAVIKNQYLDQQTALAQELAGESNLYNSGLTGTNQTLTGLTTAASGAAPIQASYSNQVLNPQTGESVGGTSGALSTAVSNAINQIKAGGGYQNAAATLSSFGPAGTNALLSALGPSFNINASNAEAAAQASNINTQGTLNTTIGAQGAQQATQNYVAAQTAYKTASSQATNLQNTLASTGINNNPQFINQKINALQNQLGSANYASFITALNETKQAYTSLLSSVGAATPTVNSQAATDIFNENSTPAQINAAIAALNTAAYAKLQPLYDQIGTYSNIGTSNSNANSTSGGWSSLGD